MAYIVFRRQQLILYLKPTILSMADKGTNLLAKTNLSQQKDAVKFAVILEGKNAAKIQ
jgi:hypothetical protein